MADLSAIHWWSFEEGRGWLIKQGKNVRISTAAVKRDQITTIAVLNKKQWKCGHPGSKDRTT
jgi:hypothetical protein